MQFTGCVAATAAVAGNHLKDHSASPLSYRVVSAVKVVVGFLEVKQCLKAIFLYSAGCVPATTPTSSTVWIGWLFSEPATASATPTVAGISHCPVGPFMTF